MTTEEEILTNKDPLRIITTVTEMAVTMIRITTPPPPQEQIQPNINVVLRSLPDFAQERDIRRTLESMEASIDEVTLIRDRETGFLPFALPCFQELNPLDH
ncbi:hypothetical protein DFQ30_004048 [Apophysomyces sp. BC1015]|nr:hypothetical protein DFQ30_004048 [Apophysomyces sp. BC1015]